MYGARWVLEIYGGSPCKVNDGLTTIIKYMIVHMKLIQTVFVYIALIEKKSVDCVTMKWQKSQLCCSLVL